MARGVDVSEHQSNRGAAWWRQWSWGIIRVHSGYRDDFMWNYHADEAREAGVPIGFYGYVVGDSNSGVAWQADRLVGISTVYKPELGWWSDIEDPTVDQAAAQAHVQRMRELVPGRHGVYSNIGQYDSLLRGCGDLPWWMADYGPNDGTLHDPNEQPPVPHRDYQIHQFTSKGGPNGSSLDVNECADLAALIARLGGTVPTPLGDDGMFGTIDGSTIYAYDGLEMLAVFGPDVNPPKVDPAKIAVVTWTDAEYQARALRRSALVAEIAAAVGPGGGLSEAEVRAVVRSELDRTKLGV